VLIICASRGNGDTKYAGFQTVSLFDTHLRTPERISLGRRSVPDSGHIWHFGGDRPSGAATGEILCQSGTDQLLLLKVCCALRTVLSRRIVRILLSFKQSLLRHFCRMSSQVRMSVVCLSVCRV